MPREANTRAASGAGSIRQRPDGRWEARVTVGNDPGTGKPIRRSIYGDTQKEVLTAMRDVLKAVDDGLYHRADAPDACASGSISGKAIICSRRNTARSRPTKHRSPHTSNRPSVL